MKFTSFAIVIATLVSSVAANYPTTADLTCRKGPGTKYDPVKTYPKGTSLKLTCQTTGESVDGNNLWDKTSDGCYASDRYIKTGSTKMVVDACSSGGTKPPPGTSAYEGKIKRSEIISRGWYWVNKHIPYSMSAYTGDPTGRKYRTDCSGFVSMALHSSAPGHNTVSLPEIAHRIQWSELKAGDLVGTLQPRIGGAIGHVTLFRSWADAKHTHYNALECRYRDGCISSVYKVSWVDGPYTAQPWRYKNVVD